jgi:hypothetical protein
MSTTVGGGRCDGDQSTIIHPIQLIISYGCQRLFLFKLIYVIIVINLFFSAHRGPQITIEGYESDHGQHESDHSQRESDHGQQEHNQNLNAEVKVNEDDDPMEEEMSDDKFFHNKQGIYYSLR